MARKDAIRLRLKKLFTGGQLETLYSDRVKQGVIWCLEQITWEIDVATSGGNTRCRLYIEGHGYKHYLAEQVNPVADRLYWYTKKPYLYPGERLALDIDYAGSSTTAEMIATGYWEKIKAGGGE